MFRTRILLLISCALVVGAIYLLPKAVVENDAEMSSPTAASANGAGHQEVPTGLQQTINQYRTQLAGGVTDQKTAIFADSLAELYQNAGRYDSAAAYFEQAASFIGTEASILKSAEAYYQAFSFSVDNAKSKVLAEKARQFFSALLEKKPAQPDLKVKLAMTFMVSEGPMQGIAMLREVLEKYPEHEQALLNMGILSIRSGQFAKAIDWLRRLDKAHPENVEGQMLLGAAYAGAGEKEKAREQYERARKMTTDPAVQQQLDAYVKDLN